MERVPQAAGQQGCRTSCGHWSGAAGAEGNKTLRDVRVTNITIGIIRLNCDWSCKLLQEVHQGNIYRYVTTELYNNVTRVERNNKALCDKCECGSKL